MSAAFEDLLAECTGPDDPQFKAAAILSVAWEPALNRSFNFGFSKGYAAGYRAAEQDMAAAWHNVAESVRAVLKQDTQAELKRLRGEVTSR